MGRKFRQKPVADTKQAGTERLECIGIAGSGPSVGVTHFSLMTAAYLSGVLCRRTAVLEQNESGSFAQLEKIFRTGKRREQPVIDGAGQPFEIRGLFSMQPLFSGRFGQRMAAGRFCGIGSRKAKMEKMV